MSGSRLKHALPSMLLLLLGSTFSQAGVMTGRELLDICQPSRTDPVYRLKLSECTGYIIGVSDTFDCRNRTLGFNWDSGRFDNQQSLVSAVVVWFRANPTLLHYQASGLVASALQTSFPCPGNIAVN